MNQNWKEEYDKHCNSCEFCLKEVGENNLAFCTISGIILGYQQCCQLCIEQDKRINWYCQEKNDGK